MTFHHQHTHGRVFRGLEARNMLQSHKRDSHGDQPKMHVPEGFDAQQKAQDDGSNGSGDSPNVAVSYVYVTMSQTFAGPAMYTTLSNGPTPTNGANGAEPTGESGKSGNGNGNGSGNGDGNGASSGPTRTSTVAVQTNSLDVAPPRTTFATSTSNIGMGASSSSAASSLAPGSVQGNANADSGAQPTSSMSGGAAAGLALGLILGIALIAGLVFYFYRRRTRLGKHEEINEKHASLTNGAGTRNPETAFRPVSIHSTHSMSPSTAPRLSLRPVTQFAPLFNANANRSNNTLNAPNASLAVANQPQSAWERHSSTARQDPFADADAVIVSEKQTRPESPPATNPFEQPERTSAESARKAAASPSPADTEVPVATLPHVEDGAVVASVEKSERPTSKASIESSTPPTPASVKSTMAVTTPPMVAAATAAAGVAGPGPAAGQTSPVRAPNNVHRVQLDFKPSMDDELGLRSGQLVRLLHEYDDGWALCVRMDRSQQGAVPRTCLSKLPVKPRPQGPPPNGRPGPPQGRPGTSQGPGPQPRPGTSHGPRSPPGPPGPSGPNADMFPRPLTPSQPNRDRSQSVTAGEASSGVPPRKPVPGQAM